MRSSGTRRLVLRLWPRRRSRRSALAEASQQVLRREALGPRAGHEAPARPSLPVVLGSLTLYTDRTVFDTAHPGLPVESFSGTPVPPNSVAECPAPFNTATNNACFPPGAIRPGISVVNTAGGPLVVLTPPFFGVPCVSVGPTFFADNGRAPVQPAGRGRRLRFPVRTPACPSPSPSSVRAARSARTTHSGGIPGAFWGVDTSDAGGISRITFNAPGENGELVCNVAFGQPVPVELQSFTIQ